LTFAALLLAAAIELPPRPLLADGFELGDASRAAWCLPAWIDGPDEPRYHLEPGWRYVPAWGAPPFHLGPWQGRTPDGATDATPRVLTLAAGPMLRGGERLTWRAWCARLRALTVTRDSEPIAPGDKLATLCSLGCGLPP
jgi:hypothetical protein